ncbi:MAG: outer membrane lipoprotein-sorting protein [Acidobacteriaceae bacterium]
MPDRTQNRFLLPCAALGMVLACGMASGQPASPASNVDLAAIVGRMSQVQHDVIADQRGYELVRRYQIFNNADSNRDGVPDKQRPQTELLARIEYAPPNQTRYEIERSTGGMGERVIRHALDHEVQLTKAPEQMEMTSRNYNFSLIGSAEYRGQNCYILESHPKRDDHNLLQSKVWVDAKTFRVLKIHGHPQKSPSFWVKDLDLTLEYSEMEGMWMHTSTQASADLRFGGPFTVRAQAMSVVPSPVTVAKEHARTIRARAVAAGALLPLAAPSH